MNGKIDNAYEEAFDRLIEEVRGKDNFPSARPQLSVKTQL